MENINKQIKRVQLTMKFENEFEQIFITKMINIQLFTDLSFLRSSQTHKTTVDFVCFLRH